MKVRSPAQILATVITIQTLISELTALPRIHFGIKSHHRQMNMAKSLLTETSTRTYTESLEKLLQNKQPTTRSILKPLSPSIRSKRALSKFQYYVLGTYLNFCFGFNAKATLLKSPGLDDPPSCLLENNRQLGSPTIKQIHCQQVVLPVLK